MANLFRCIGGSQSPIPIGTKYEYAYTGKVEQFIAQFSGLYRFECFGAYP